MRELLNLREASVAALMLALGLAACTASGTDSPKKKYSTVQIAPDTTEQDMSDQTVEFDVLRNPVYSKNRAKFVITDGEIPYDQEISCDGDDLVVSDPAHPSVDPTTFFGSIVCIDNKITKSDWPDVLNTLQLHEMSE